MSAHPIAAGARCGRHPELAAERTCVRCGDYVCTACRGPAGLCASCAERLGSAGRGASTLDTLLRWALARWRKHLLGLVASVLVLSLIVYPFMLAMDAWGA